jgi:tyrosyl-tRNA synthetase
MHQLGHQLTRLGVLFASRSTMRLNAPSMCMQSHRFGPATLPHRSPSSHQACAATAAAATEHVVSPTATSTPQNVVAVLRARGLVQELTSPELETASSTETLLVYCGFDPTAESLHLGNLLGIIVLSWFQRCGHKPVALLGGATARVGDPSGKSAERPVLSEEAIQRNIAGIERTLRSLLQPPAGSNLHEPLIVNNLDWFGQMPLLTFLRDIGKQARVGTMLAKDSVRTRLESESGISYTEFTYQLLQGYDFVHMARDMGVRVQIGGSDQWGNITAGTDLVRRMLGGGDEEGGNGSGGEKAMAEQGNGAQKVQCFGLTFPLLLKADGTKFGKSESGAVWLSSDMLSPYQMYQFLLKSADADVGKFLRMLTFLPLEEIEALESSMLQPEYVPNTAQKLLAEEVTRFVHGEEGLQQALKATAALAPGSQAALDAATLEAAAGNAPSATLTRLEVVDRPLADVMVAAGMQPSKAAVRRLIKGGGVSMNNAKVEEETAVVREGDLIEGKLMLLAAGKKNKLLVRIES